MFLNKKIIVGLAMLFGTQFSLVQSANAMVLAFGASGGNATALFYTGFVSTFGSEAFGDSMIADIFSGEENNASGWQKFFFWGGIVLDEELEGSLEFRGSGEIKKLLEKIAYDEDVAEDIAEDISELDQNDHKYEVTTKKECQQKDHTCFKVEKVIVDTIAGKKVSRKKLKEAEYRMVEAVRKALQKSIDDSKKRDQFGNIEESHQISSATALFILNQITAYPFSNVMIDTLYEIDESKE